ncbi:hypothetical protein AAMO2058_000913300 [Amorphochlora amoebiformis]
MAPVGRKVRIRSPKSLRFEAFPLPPFPFIPLFFILIFTSILLSNLNYHTRIDNYRELHSQFDPKSEPQPKPNSSPGALELSKAVSSSSRSSRSNSNDSGSEKRAEGGCERFENTDFFGSDIKGDEGKSFEECCEKCWKIEACGAFTFIPNDGSCWLKHPAAARSPSPKNAVHSGIIQSRRPPPPAPAPESLADPNALRPGQKIPIVVIAYNRADYLKRTLESILSAIPVKQADSFPLIVSQQGNHKKVEDVIGEFQSKLLKHLRFTYHDNGKRQKRYEAQSWINYYKMSAHYRFAISKSLSLDSSFEHLIVMEDDLEVAPDFFEFFTMASQLLDADPTLYCASAWNDNGMAPLVRDNRALRRTDVFPGLGWMLTRRLWNEIQDIWPLAFWDEAMRESPIRKGRSCIYPEVNRAYTFGSKGNSQTGGSWWKRFLEPILLSAKPEAWTTLSKDIPHSKHKYDQNLRSQIRAAKEVDFNIAAQHTLPSHISIEPNQDILVTFANSKDFENKGKRFGLLHEYKEGHPRASYCGALSFWAKNGRRIVFAHSDTVRWAQGEAAECDCGSKLT